MPRRYQDDYYAILQVHPKAEPEVIQAAYRRLAAKYHPDKGGDAEQMKRINAAWEVLGDPQKRREYDLWYFTLGPGRGRGMPQGIPMDTPHMETLRQTWDQLKWPLLITAGLVLFTMVDVFRLGIRFVPEWAIVLTLIYFFLLRPYLRK